MTPGTSRPSLPTRSGYRLNLYPVTVSSPTVPVLIGPYADEDALAAVRGDFGTLRFRRSGDLVYVWAPRGDLPAIPKFRQATLTLAAEPHITGALLRAGIGQSLADQGFTALGRGRYAHFERGNYLRDAWKTRPSEIGIHPLIIVGTEILNFPEQQPELFLRVDIAQTVRIDFTVDRLIGFGIDPVGRYVRATADLVPEYGPRLIGRVARVDGDTLVLEDTREGSPLHIAATSCQIEASRPNLMDVVGALNPADAARIDAALRRRSDNEARPRPKQGLIEQALTSRIAAAPIGLTDGVTASVGDPITPRIAAPTFACRMLAKPVFSYDPVTLKTHTVPDYGIRQHGPYSQRRMGTRPLRILLLAPERFKGAAETFLTAFRAGIDDDATYSGFTGKYRLPEPSIETVFFPWDHQPAKDAYYNAALGTVKSTYDLCFIIIRAQFKELQPPDNPYHVCKVLYLSLGIPVQEISVEALQAGPAQFPYVLNNIALSSYAKVGGTPYVLRAQKSERQELLFGIGRSIERPNGGKVGRIRQIIGFTTVFRSDGDYLLNACTAWTDDDNYSKLLEDVVLNSVREVVAIEGLPSNAPLRLIFHVFKRVGAKEQAALQNVVAKLTTHDVEFALVQVNDSHELQLFDTTNVGNPRVGKRDAFLPPRQLSVEMGTSDRLVVLMGPAQYRGYGTFSPVRLSLDDSSTFRDIDYLADQVFAFSFMSWRSFNVGVLPATIRYSELMAEMSKRLRSVLPWNEDLVRERLARKLWFL